tara:strand:- start:130 stop:309 length:180 start_codon:yes stop_codon:yes gene_type:complete
MPLRYKETDGTKHIAAMSHGGVRTDQACQDPQSLGFDISTLEGGIQAGPRAVDPIAPEY